MVATDKYSLLIIDDDTSNLSYLRETFNEDYNVISYDNPVEALKQIKSSKPKIDLVITDQKMPEMSGIEFLHEISKLYPKVIKIILTGYTKTNDLIEAINTIQVYRYITKPVDSDYLQSEVKQALETYQDERQKVNLNHVGDALVVLNDQGNIESMNVAGEQIFGYSSKEVIGKSFKTLFYEPQGDKYNEYFDALRMARSKNRPITRETTGLRKDGTTIPLDLSISQGAAGPTNFFVISARSAQKRKLSEEQSKFQAYHDLLTGLPNRRLFSDRLAVAVSAAVRQKETVAIICMNLDRFQIINNTLGYTVGDQVLEKVARMLLRCAREGDTVARFAADEFAFLLPNVKGAEEAARFAQRILEMFAAPLVVDKREFYLTCSMGISLAPSDGREPEALLTAATAAMAAAKKAEGNTYQFFNPELNMIALDRLVFESGLRKAIERNELLLYFQPIVDARLLKTRAVEALIRWKHQDLGMVSPAEFIPVAEETGVISSIGEWVLRTACAQNKLWQERGFEKIPVAVNVSSRQFKEERFVDIVRQILDETKLEPRYLELEVTESLMMENVESSIKKLQELKAMGIVICIDDFGTGYSSFSYLKRFPIDVLKIDQSFVRDLNTNSKDAAIASAIIDIAHRLELEVVAEGVETKEQLTFLRSQYCDKLQGFLFSPPMPPDTVFAPGTQSWERILEEPG